MTPEINKGLKTVRQMHIQTTGSRHMYTCQGVNCWKGRTCMCNERSGEGCCGARVVGPEGRACSVDVCERQRDGSLGHVWRRGGRGHVWKRRMQYVYSTAVEDMCGESVMQYAVCGERTCGMWRRKHMWYADKTDMRRRQTCLPCGAGKPSTCVQIGAAYPVSIASRNKPTILAASRNKVFLGLRQVLLGLRQVLLGLRQVLLGRDSPVACAPNEWAGAQLEYPPHIPPRLVWCPPLAIPCGG